MNDDKLKKLMAVYKNAPMEDILTDEEKGEFGATDFSNPDDRIGSAYAAMDQTMKGFMPQEQQIPMAPGQELEEPINDIVEGPNTSEQKPSIPIPVENEEEVSQISTIPTDNDLGNKKAELMTMQQQYRKMLEDQAKELEKAKGKDSDTDCTNRMLEAGAIANRGLAGQGGHNIINSAPSKLKADSASKLQKEHADRLKNMIAEYKMSGKGGADLDLELKRAKLETEKLKQAKTKSDISKIEHGVKAAKEKSDNELKESVKAIDTKVDEMETAKEALKKGGVTGLFDATIGAGIDKVKGNPERATRMLLDKLKVDDALLRIANTKGAISDSEMKLFLAPAPSNFDDEKTWIAWLDNKMKIANKAKKGLSGEATSESPKSSNQVERRTKDGRIAIFDADTKEFIKYKD